MSSENVGMASHVEARPVFQAYFTHVDGTAISRGIIGLGMTGLILFVDHTRVLKVPKLYSLDGHEGEDLDHTRLGNQTNCEIFLNEKAIYERLEHHEGIIHCFKASDDALELAYAKEGDLKTYIETQTEPQLSTKIDWILSLIDTLSYIHSRRVLVDEIALRNIVILDKKLKVTDFGQSILLPMTADMATVDDGAGLNAKIEMLHLGWIFYAIATWQNKRYYYFGCDDPAWPKPEELPAIDSLFCEPIIKKCWTAQYEMVEQLQKEAIALFATVSHVQARH
jgi:serine/threonine protein kinase